MIPTPLFGGCVLTRTDKYSAESRFAENEQYMRCTQHNNRRESVNIARSCHDMSANIRPDQRAVAAADTSGLLSWPRAVGGLRVPAEWRHVVASRTLLFAVGICARCRSNALARLPSDSMRPCCCLSNAGCTNCPGCGSCCLARMPLAGRFCTRLALCQAQATSRRHAYHCTTGYKSAGCESVRNDRPTAAAPLACA